MDRVKETLEAYSKSMSDLSFQLANSDRYAGTLVESLSKLSTIGTKQGSIWSVFIRFFSGNRALYEFQNRLKSITLVAKTMTNIERDRMKALEEQNKFAKENGQLLNTFLTSYKHIEKIQSSSNQLLAKTISSQDTVNKLRIREMGFSDYLKQNRKDALFGIKEQLRLERSLVDLDKSRANLSDNSKRVLGDRFKTGFFGDPEKESRIIQLLNISEEIKDLDTIIPELEGEDKEKAQSRMRDMGLMTKVLTEELGEMGITARRVGGTGGGGVYSLEETPTESFFKRLNSDPRGTIKKLFLPSQKLLELIKNLAIFTIIKKNIQIIGKIALLVLPLLGQVGLAIGMIGLLVFILHQSGFIERMGAFLNNENFQKILGFYFSMVVLIFTGIFNVVAGVLDILIGLFSGDGGEVYAGIERIGKGLVQILVGFLGSIVSGAILLAIGAVMTATNIVVAAVAGVITAIKEGASTATKLIPGAGLIAGISLGAKFGAAGSVGGPLGALIGAGVGLAVGTGAHYLGRGAIEGIDGLASGGTVNQGGMFLVGERGPELVNLPAGSAVFNNSQTRGMGNTINVSVNGRVGASDSELDDIARKIGQKINLEMNRYNNAGYRV